MQQRRLVPRVGRENDETGDCTVGKAPLVLSPSASRFPASPLQVPATPTAGRPLVRLVLVRHAQSANKGRRPGQEAVADPGLTELGSAQADALGRRLAKDFRNEPHNVAITCSPMRRCLLTILPAVQELGLAPGLSLCHGGCYEFGCAGTAHAGSSAADISKLFPEFRTLGFREDGKWDYLGTSIKETEEECRARAARVVQWLCSSAAAMTSEGRSTAKTLILTTHQTFADLLCQILVHGDAKRWSYGEISFKLQNAGMTELFLQPNGRATLGVRNDGSHLAGMKGR